MWLKEFRVVPDECVMDGAGGLHWSACKVFNGVELETYVNYCFKMIKGAVTEWNYRTILRFDVCKC